MPSSVQRPVVPLQTQRLADWHWRLIWDDNTLDIMLREDGTSLAGGIAGLFTRLGPKNSAPAIEREPVFAFADSLRHNDADVRLGPDRASVPWDGMSVVARPRGLAVVLSCTLRSVEAHLVYDIHPSGVLLKQGVIKNVGTQKSVTVTGAPSFALTLTDPVETAVFLSGEWGEETQINRVRMQRAPIYLESRAGKTGFEYSPWIALEANSVTTIAQLAWSGNWYVSARRGPGATHLAGGLPELGMVHTLLPGQELHLPQASIVRKAGGLNAATHCLHEYRRAERPDRDREIPVQFNSWYPHPGEPDMASMAQMVPMAKRLNCEVFVLDAGWYTTDVEDPSEDWWTRTGDWSVNTRLFPQGLAELSETCRDAGLDFGIWFEPEAISPSSTVRRDHAEWLHHIDGNEPLAGTRAILNLGIDAARRFARDRILAILADTAATWMKWDFNTDLRQGGWAPTYQGPKDRDPLIAHYEGLYLLQDEIRAAAPGLTLEMCAGGGGRFDSAIMAHAHTNWMSDQKQPLLNLSVHFGSQLAHPPVACNDWIIEWPPNSVISHKSRHAVEDDRGDLSFRILVPMMGTLGISAPVSRWRDDEIDLAGRYVDWYRRNVRPRLNRTDQYLLTDQPPLDGNGDWAAIWYAEQDKSGGVVFCFRLLGEATHNFQLLGLDPDRQYRLESVEGHKWQASGRDLASGLQISLDAHFRGTAVSVQEIA